MKTCSYNKKYKDDRRKRVKDVLNGRSLSLLCLLSQEERKANTAATTNNTKRGQEMV
jgi:hypothetical protein